MGAPEKSPYPQRPGMKTDIDRIFHAPGTGQSFQNYIELFFHFIMGICRFDMSAFKTYSAAFFDEPASGAPANIPPRQDLPVQRTQQTAQAPTTPLSAKSVDDGGGIKAPPVREEFSSSATSQSWTLSVQMTGQEKNPKGECLAKGKLILKDSCGKEHSFDFRSGGFGEILPGLDGSKKGITYALGWDTLMVNSQVLKNNMKGPDGTGSWITLGSDRKFTDRGAVLGVDKPGSGFFGIHTDGDSGSGKINDGTRGCIGLAPGDDKKFFALLQSIPENQRPTVLAVQDPITPALTKTAKPRL